MRLDTKQKKNLFIGLVILLFISILFVIFFGGNMFDRTMKVGKDVKESSIQEFYFTRSGSTFPPTFQRYYLYQKDGKHYFYHEKREGDVFPLTEEHKTVFGTLELSSEQWATLYSYLEGGTVEKRKENLDSGGDGPWLYLYWDKDEGEIQQFTFETYEKEYAFEKECIALKELTK